MILSGDYACFDAGGLRFYYGYESTIDNDAIYGDDEMWCFEVSLAIPGQRKTILKLPYPEIGVMDNERYEVGECLVRGIQWLIRKGLLGPTPGLLAGNNEWQNE